MTIDTPRRPAGPAPDHDDDLIAGLWEEAPFPRLPWDAPHELRDLVEEVQNPRRVYAIHHASRRHGFQILVQKYIVQLRDGCGNSACTTPTCLSCRKRIAGTTPFRRYNTTSARTLAMHLAGQDNAEDGLCPTLATLGLPKKPPAALNSLIFTRKEPATRPPPSQPKDKKDNVPPVKPPVKPPAKPALSRTCQSKPDQEPQTKGKKVPPLKAQKGKKVPAKSSRITRQKEKEKTPTPPRVEPNFTIREKAATKDYRSFAANMFGTVAFKMMEWLTPAAVEEMTAIAESLQTGQSAEADEPKPKTKKPKSATTSGTATPSGSTVSKDAGTSRPVPDQDATTPDQDAATPESLDVPPSPPLDVPPPSPPLPPANHTNVARSASARLRSTPTTRDQRKLSLEPLLNDNEDLLPSLRSPLLPSVGVAADKTPAKTIKPSTSSMPRPSKLPSSGMFDEVAAGKASCPTLKTPKIKTSPVTPGLGHGRFGLMVRSGSDTSFAQSGLTSGTRSPTGSSSRSPSSPATETGDANNANDANDANDADDADDADANLDATLHGLLPQTLPRLDARIIDLFYTILLEHKRGREQHYLKPKSVEQYVASATARPTPMKRRQVTGPGPRAGPLDAATLDHEWLMFIQQSIFYALSSPRSAVSSLSEDGELYDSQTMWYCLLQLTRGAPSLVLHSLWTAAEALFAPPKELLALRFPGEPLSDALLSHAEASEFMAVGLHALVAVMPVLNVQYKMTDMSRMRAYNIGLSAAVPSSTAARAAWVEYGHALLFDPALRLARRLFAALAARQYFATIAHEVVKDKKDQAATESRTDDDLDVLGVLFKQLDAPELGFSRAYTFGSADRMVHETRVPTLLLDWARNVLQQDWSGRGIVPADGPFGGALALMKALYERRQRLILGDTLFCAYFFSQRLDPLRTPVEWLAFTSTRTSCHLLDFSFLFAPSTLISFFRAINFRRMSRAYEEATSLRLRMQAIVSPGSLIVNQLHKTVLSDMLATASTKYFVLSVGRDTVLEDTFDQLFRRETRELLRPLKVLLGKATGEEGFDSGGVQQEFFRLVVGRILDPSFGVFTVDSRTRMAWFNPTTLEADWTFEVVGLIFSLAVYNSLPLPVTFPKALYRKLLGEPVNELHHIADGWPDLASGLTALLEWNEADGSVEDVFTRSYEYEVLLFGQHYAQAINGKDTWPAFQKIALGQPMPAAGATDTTETTEETPLVTSETRSAYVTDYIRYLTDVTVRPQFEAFARGFHKCLHPKSLKLLNAGLLQSLVEGEQDINVGELKQNARYVGWDETHHTVRDFWRIVEQYDDRMKRKLLEFVTASDRLPVGGAKHVQFVLQKNGVVTGDGGHLPTAYTCYGTLLLPEYDTAKGLEDRLAMALENAQGFGFA